MDRTVKDDLLDAALARCEHLRAVIAETSTKLKLLYMAAGLGQRTGREALADLSEEIKKLDAVVYEQQEPAASTPTGEKG